MKPDLPIDTQILWLAAELVEKGHCKGRLAAIDWHTCNVENGTRWCAMGAIMLASRLLGQRKASTRICDRLEEKVGDIPVWNDAPERTAAEVALALRTA